MRTRTVVIVAAVAIVASAVLYGQTRPRPAAASGYLLTPKVIVDILDAPPTPTVALAPDRKTIALMDRKSMPSIAHLAEPIHRIAGARINPKTNGRQQRGGEIVGITLKSIATGTEKKIVVPPDPNIGGVSFAPDGRHL